MYFVITVLFPFEYFLNQCILNKDFKYFLMLTVEEGDYNFYMYLLNGPLLRLAIGGFNLVINIVNIA